MQFIILTGPKHSGKTSAGKELASLLSCGSTDLDNAIARQSGQSPRALFAGGPEIFRKAEEVALAAIFEASAATGTSRMVIATGGGIIDNPGALALLKNVQSAIFVFLDLSAETAWERINGEGELPPFLGTENPQAVHRSLHGRRSTAYRRLASFTVNAEGKSPAEIAREICCSLENIR
jgi:shikimate kinase